jgi:hypothetical protein
MEQNKSNHRELKNMNNFSKVNNFSLMISVTAEPHYNGKIYV